MNVLTSIQEFLKMVNDNWAMVVTIIGLIIVLYKRMSDLIKFGIAKDEIKQIMLKLVSDAEKDYSSWVAAGSIKRAQVIKEIYTKYPILSRFINQEAIIRWVDNEIDSALVTLRQIINENKSGEEIKESNHELRNSI